jgi:RNA polymerase sigma factor (sigma-70 family)
MKPLDSTPRLEPAALVRAYDRSNAARWGLSRDAFQAALEASIAHAFAGQDTSAARLEQYVSSLHVEDLALAAACAAGHEPAWDHFMREHRPALYRAADAMDPSGGARELADSLYADLFGWRDRAGSGRESLFRYFHGRSRLSTWLRAVLAQRRVDALRAGRRLDPLPDQDSGAELSVAADPRPDRARWVDAMRRALAGAIAALAPRDRLRLTCYYVQDLTLAAIGRLLREHEATVSRHLTRTRREIRDAIERRLREEDRLDDRAIAECFESLAADAGTMDLGEMLASDGPAVLRAAVGRKMRGQDRSK